MSFRMTVEASPGGSDDLVETPNEQTVTLFARRWAFDQILGRDAVLSNCLAPERDPPAVHKPGPTC